MTTAPRRANPPGRLSAAIPPTPAIAASIAARLVGAAFALAYAYNQDVLFPGRHFPRTWVFVAVIAGVAVVSIVPWSRLVARPGLATWIAALGCGVLVFGGANLAQRAEGIVVLIAGVVAWLALALGSHARGASMGALVSGLLSGSLLTFALVALTVSGVPG